MMASFSNVSGLIIILMSYNCEVSSGNNSYTQFSKIEEELLNMMESILNLRRDLHKERTERRENTEVLNRTISQCTCEVQGINQQQNYSENVRVRSDILGCVDPKKAKILERGLAKEKILRIMTEDKISSLEKELETLRNLVESRLNEQKDDLKEQKVMIKAFKNDIGQVHANLSSLKTDINNKASDIGSIRTDVRSTKGDTEEKLRNFEARIKTVEGNVESIRTTLSAIQLILVYKALKSDSPQIAFHARLSNSHSQFSPGQAIIFDDVYVNLGNGYQIHRGVFRVPIEGIYIVLMTVSSESMKAPDYEVVRNGTPLCRASVATLDEHTWLGSPCNAILPLNVGDEIWGRVGFYRSTDKIRVGNCGPDQSTTGRACVRLQYPTETKSESAVVLAWEIWTNLQGYENITNQNLKITAAAGIAVLLNLNYEKYLLK